MRRGHPLDRRPGRGLDLGSDAADHLYRVPAPNSPLPDGTAHGVGRYKAASFHAGGVNVVTGDGGVRFVRDAVAIDTWRALATRGGGEVVGND